MQQFKERIEQLGKDAVEETGQGINAVSLGNFEHFCNFLEQEGLRLPEDTKITLTPDNELYVSCETKTHNTYSKHSLRFKSNGSIVYIMKTYVSWGMGVANVVDLYGTYTIDELTHNINWRIRCKG